MKLYYEEVLVGNYTIMAVAETRQKCVSALVREYRKQFGSFEENGFQNKADWLDYHGVCPEACREIELNKAITR